MSRTPPPTESPSGTNKRRASLHSTPTADEGMCAAIVDFVSASKRAGGRPQVCVSTDRKHFLYVDKGARDKFSAEWMAHTAYTLGYGTSACNEYSTIATSSSIAFAEFGKGKNIDQCIILPASVVNDIFEHGNSAQYVAEPDHDLSSPLQQAVPNAIAQLVRAAQDYPSKSDTAAQRELEALVLEGMCP